MEKIDHKLIESLEYNGVHGGRYTCSNCLHFGNGTDYQQCDIQGIEVFEHNNICKGFDAKIKNPSMPEFNFNDYLEFLGSDFYRPWSVDTNIIVGSARFGEVTIDGGKQAKRDIEYTKHLEENDIYKPDRKPFQYLYKSYDKPYCKARLKDCYVRYNGHTFHIDYVRYRHIKTVENNEIKFNIHTWKDKPRQRKYNKEVNGVYNI